MRVGEECVADRDGIVYAGELNLRDSTQGQDVVIRGGEIGGCFHPDAMRRWPALRQQFPNAHIEVLGDPHIAELR